MSFNYSKIDLPITEIVPEVKKSLVEQNTLIVNAPPGAGKSTLLPLALLDEKWLSGKKIIMLEPRRLAARAIAQRMSSLLNKDVGSTVGYRIRFETRVTSETKLEVVTEGILTRMLQQDNALEDVGLVIFDEFHERGLHADVALALCREAQQVLRPDLRILIMSATLNMPELSSLLKSPVVISEGRQYPVEIIYTQDADERLLPEFVSRAVITAANEKEGDILVFLPGEGEIRQTEELLQNNLTGFKIHPLYGQLPPAAQQQALVPDRSGNRKIVLATSIAETSLTIEGIRIVIDSGFARRSKFDPKSGLSKLETIRLSKDSADQRAGRAGRLSAGTCYRLWTKATDSRLQENRTPEILEADLTDLVLDLAQWGVKDPHQLTWLTPPPKASLAQASDTLHHLEALDNHKITDHGRAVHKLACHPRIAHMLLLAKDVHDKQLGTDIAAILEERDVLGREAGIDINLRVEALRRWRANNKSSGRFSRIEKVAASYRNMLSIEENNGSFDVQDSGLLLAHAYPERIAFARPGNNAQFQLANGRYATIGHKDDLAHESWLAVAHMDLREGLGKIFLASPLNPTDLKSLVKEKKIVTWDTKKGGLIANTELRIGSIVLQSKPLTNVTLEQKLEAICKAIKTEGQQLLNFDEDFQQLQNRILSLQIWNDDKSLPDVTVPSLLENVKQWLGPYLGEIKKNEELKKIDLSAALISSLDWEKQKELERLAPSKLEVPSGSKIKISYFANGETPVLAVRLQEVFGVSDTPAVNNGNRKVVMHLLSPGYKPVQVTSDLNSFWNNLYFEVRKELQRRYPKHAWPENPWTAAPVAKGRSHKY